MITVGNVPNNPSTGVPWVFAYSNNIRYVNYGNSPTASYTQTSGLFSSISIQNVIAVGWTTIIPTFTVGNVADIKLLAVTTNSQNNYTPIFTSGTFVSLPIDNLYAVGEGFKQNVYVEGRFSYYSFMNPVAQTPSQTVKIPMGTNWNYQQVFLVDPVLNRLYPPVTPQTYWS